MTTTQILKPKRGKSQPELRGAGRKDRFDDLVSRVREVALGLGPGEKLPGVYDLRDTMGVSVATLTSALDELEARRVIVRRPGVGIFTSPDAGKRVISLVCDPTFFRSGGGSPFWDMLIKQARSRADSHDELLDLHFSSIVGDSLELPSSLMADIAAGRISGVVYIGTFRSGVRRIEEHGVPVVVFAGPGSHIVGLDSEGMMRSGAEVLGNAGCRHIAMARPDDRVIDREDIARFRDEALRAFREGLAANQAPFDASLVRPVTTTLVDGPWMPTASAQEQGFITAKSWFALPSDERPDGIVVSEDLMTLGILAAAQQARLEVGRDVLIATHTNAGSAMLIGWEEKIVSLTVDPREVATVMFEMLEQLMDGREDVSNAKLVSPVVGVGRQVEFKSGK